MGEVKAITIEPTGTYVLVENPLTKGLADEIIKKAEKMPEKDREAYVREHHQSIFENIKVVAVGEDVDQKKIKPGDIMVSNPNLLKNSYPVLAEQYLICSSNLFIGKQC